MLAKEVTRQTRTRATRKQVSIPPLDKVASMRIDHDNQQVVVTTKTMIMNQLNRDGPKIRRSFDSLAHDDIAACSEVFGRAIGLIVRHLPRLDDDGYKATVSRILHTASNTYLATIEVARHGYRRQYGILARSFIEAIATVIVIAVKPTALAEFHAGTLNSPKCVSWSKDIIPILGQYYGMLSNEFVHVGRSHAGFEPASAYQSNEEALGFILGSMRGNVWLLYMATELVFHDEVHAPRYWKPMGDGVAFDPSDSERRWMGTFLNITDGAQVW